MDGDHFGFLSCVVLFFFAIPTLIASYAVVAYFLWKQSNKLKQIKTKSHNRYKGKTDRAYVSNTPSVAEVDATTRFDGQVSFYEYNCSKDLDSRKNQSSEIESGNEMSSKDVSFENNIFGKEKYNNLESSNAIQLIQFRCKADEDYASNTPSDSMTEVATVTRCETEIPFSEYVLKDIEARMNQRF